MKLDKLIAWESWRERDLVMAMVAARILKPKSMPYTTRRWNATSLPHELGIADADEDDLMPLDGTLYLEGDLFKSVATTDDITPQLIVADSAARTETITQLGTLGAPATGSIAVAETLVVTEGDLLKLRVTADSPVDVTALSWVPRLYYTGSPELADAFNADGTPMVEIFPPYDVEIYLLTDLITQQASWRVPLVAEVSCPNKPSGPCGDGLDNDEDGDKDCDDPYCQPPQPAINSIRVKPTAWTTHLDGDVVFTTKRSGELAHKETLVLAGGSHPPVEIDLAVTPGDELYFDFSSRDQSVERINHSVQVTYWVRDEVFECETNSDCSPGAVCQTVACPLSGAPAQCAASTDCPGPWVCAAGVCEVQRCSLVPVKVVAPSAFFGVGLPELWPRSYRGWSVLGYDDAGVNGSKPIDEARLPVEGAIPLGGGAQVYPLVATPREARWQGANDQIWVASTGVSSSRVNNEG